MLRHDGERLAAPNRLRRYSYLQFALVHVSFPLLDARDVVPARRRPKSDASISRARAAPRHRHGIDPRV
jgi:hypothetical protein